MGVISIIILSRGAIMGFIQSTNHRDCGTKSGGILVNLNKLLLSGILASLTVTACAPTTSTNSIQKTDDAIIGGTEVEATDSIQSSIVAVYDAFEGQICTGSLISKNLVLTAAHCIGFFTEDMHIFFGTVITKESERRQVVAVEVSQVWENRRNEDTDTGDIAILKFSGDLPEGYKPAKFLGNKTYLKAGAEVILAGYGISDGKTGEGIGILRRTSAKIDNPAFSISEFLVDQTQGTGACHGDSGGPAYISIRGQLYLAGVVSRGVKDEANDCSQYGAFTNTLYYKSWINRMATKLTRSLVDPNQALGK